MSHPRWSLGVAALLVVAWPAACGDGTVEPVEPPEPPNQAPVVAGTMPSLELAVGDTATVDVSVYFNDPDGDALTYSAATSDTAVTSVAVFGTTVRVIAVAKGSPTVTVTASDPGGLSAQQSFGVTVPNRGPVSVDSIPDLELAASTATVDVSVYFNDPDGDALMYSAAASDTAVASVSVSGTTVTVSAVAEGPAMVTVTARDPGGLAVDQSFGVTVPNLAPEAVGSIPDKELTRRLFVVVSAYFNDPDGDTLTYSAATSNSAVATVSVSDTAVSISPVARGSATTLGFARSWLRTSGTRRTPIPTRMITTTITGFLPATARNVPGSAG